MRFLLLALHLHRAKLSIAALALALVCIVALAVLLPQSAGTAATPLGNVYATLPATSTGALAHPMATPAIPPGSGDSQAVPGEREQSAALDPDRSLQPAVLASLNCLRALSTHPTLVLDARLSDDAAALGRAFAAHPGRPPGELGADAYAFVALVPLGADDLAAVTPGAVGGVCRLGDIDLAQLGLPPDVSAVGIAVFVDASPGDAWDTTTAVIVAR